MSESSPDATETIELIALRILQTRLQAAGTVIVLYDYALTLPTEISEIWNARLNGAQILYIWTRYTLIVNTLISIPVDSLLWNHDISVSDHVCRGFYTFSDSVFDLFTQIGIYGIMIMRTYAIYQKNRWVLVLLGTVSVFVCALGAHFTDWRSRPYENELFRDCEILTKPNIVFLSFVEQISVLALDTLVFVSTVAKTFRHTMRMRKTGTKHGLTYVILRDGIMYFLYKLLLTTFGIIVYFTRSIDPSVITITSYLTNPVVMSLIGRLVLNLRRVSPLHMPMHRHLWLLVPFRSQHLRQILF
ncbi:hypothetical protein BD410DRAFT_793038 [Rickenella mellea]|uniref:DUF6533 domain-containing protein n=1 Tax=Rickenella mellea TaxID=50990 RepID=A0A4Y7PTC8_9AGAM|nr:hypothetical protein BD410DRAFT_793038 [Rickenella mellea]